MDTAGLFPQSIHIPHTKKATSPKLPFHPCPINKRSLGGGGEGGGKPFERPPPPLPNSQSFPTAALDDHALEGGRRSCGSARPGVLQRRVHEAAMVGALWAGGGEPRGTDTFRQQGPAHGAGRPDVRGSRPHRTARAQALPCGGRDDARGQIYRSAASVRPSRGPASRPEITAAVHMDVHAVLHDSLPPTGVSPRMELTILKATS